MRTSTLKKIGLVFLFVLIAAIYGYRLWFPSEPYYDEVHYVNFFRQLIYHDTYALHSNCHPPLWHLLVALCIELFGDHALSWRIIPLLAHFGVLYVTYLLAKKLTNNASVACLTVFILLFDCLSLTQARAAMMNSLMLLFILLSVYFFLDVFKENAPYNRDRLKKSGTFWALSLGTKFVSVNLLLFFAPLLAIEWTKRTTERSKIVKDLAVYFFLFPVILILCVHMFIPFLKDSSVADIYRVLAFNFHYNTTSHQFHSYASQWWSWPLLLRPISFFFKGHLWGSPGATCETILAIGNPVVFWIIPLATFNLIWESLKKRSRIHGIVLLGFLSQWMSFGILGRTQFFHYFYQAMPFVAMAVALLLEKVCAWKWGGKWIVVVYLVAVAAMFAFWYPLLIGGTVSRSFFYQHMWLRSWI